MRITLFSTGQEIEVPISGEKKGRARAVQAFERENAARESGGATPPGQRRNGTFLSQLSATTEGSQVSTAAGRADNPESIQSPDGLSPEAMAQAVYAEMGADIIGSDVRAKLRRMVSRKATADWNAKQRLHPGPPSAAEVANFRQSIEDGVASAIAAYARLKLTSPAKVLVLACILILGLGVKADQMFPATTETWTSCFTNSLILSGGTTAGGVTNEIDFATFHTIQLTVASTNSAAAAVDRSLDGISWIVILTNSFGTPGGVAEWTMTGKWTYFRLRLYGSNVVAQVQYLGGH